MTLLSRDSILSASDITYDVVPCPEWGGDVRVKSLSGHERDTFETTMDDADGVRRDVRAKLAIAGCVDASDAPLFTAPDVEALSAKNAAPLDRIFDRVRELSGMTPKAVAGLEKNSDAAASGVTASDSPSSSAE